MKDLTLIESPRSGLSALQRVLSSTCVLPALIAAAFGMLYLLTPTADYFWDGITFSLQIEKVAHGERDPALLFHQSHLLYNAFGFLLYRATLAIGLPVRALTLLQTANSIIGAIGTG